jgi:tetratricopeptide (TPR) repeat protein
MKREHLLRVRHLVLLMLVLCVSLFILAPSTGRLEADLTGSDSLSIKYLYLLTAMHPSDTHIRLRLAQALLNANRREEADRLLDSIPLSDPGQLLLRVLKLHSHLARCHDEKPQPPHSADCQELLVQELESLLKEPLPAEELRGLAALSLSWIRPDLAARIYLRLIEVDPEQRQKWLMEGARQFLASGQPGQAGELYAGLEQLMTDPLQRRRYALLALAALTAAGPGKRAQALAHRYVESFSDDMDVLRAAARIALENNQPAIAGRYYAELSRLAKDQSQELNYARLTIMALTAADQSRAALRAAEGYLQLFPSDYELLRSGVRLALGNGEIRHAQEWGRELLKLHPSSSALAEQINIELYAGDAAMALELAQRLYGKHPSGTRNREQFAVLAERAGRPLLALAQWAALAIQTGKPDYLDKAIKMAPQLYDFETLAKLLAYKAQHGPLSDTELTSLVDTFESIGEPERLVAILRDYLLRYPRNRFAWESLAKVQERRGDLKESLSLFEHVSREFGSDMKESTHRAELLWQLHRPMEGYLLLRDVLDHAGVATTQKLLARTELAMPPAATLSQERKQTAAEKERGTFFHLLAELLWFSEPRPESLEEYRMLWQLNGMRPDSAERYIRLAEAQGLLDEGIKVAEAAFMRFKNVDFLLLAMELAADNERWQDMGRLIRIAREHSDELADNKQYAYYVAEYYTQKGDYQRALRAYFRVLELDPGTIAARVAILELLTEHSDESKRYSDARSRQELLRLLTEWRPLAQQESALWLPFASGWAMLGRSREALAYYDREWRLRKSDHLWLLGYVSTLDAVSRSSDVRVIRRYALKMLRPDAMAAAHRGATKAERELLNAYVELVRDTYGAGKGSRWLSGVLHRDLDPEVTRGLAVNWRVSDGEEWNAWVPDSQTIQRQNPWGRFRKAPKPGQEQVQATIADATVLAQASNSDAAEPPPAPLRVLGPDAAAGEEQIPDRSLQTTLESGVESIEDLVTLYTGISERYTHGAFALGGRAAVNYLLLNPVFDPEASPTEGDLSLYGMWRHRLGRLELGLTANLRADASLFGGFLAETFNLWEGGTLRLEGHLNELTSDTSWFRIYGARHRALLSFYTSFLKDFFLSIQAQGYQYHTRLNEQLGGGIATDYEVGYRINRVRPVWTVRISGGFIHNFALTNKLPEFGGDSSSASSIFDDLSLNLIYAGIGTRVEHLFPGVAPIGAGRVRYLLDLWAGWMWPLNIPVFEVHTGVSLALPRKQEVSLTGFVENNRWLGPGVINAGVALRYLFR